MNFLAACLCDSAADYQGKLCVLGTFDSIIAPRFPATHAACAIALRMVVRPGDEGSHEIRVTLIDADGRHLLAGGGARVPLHLPPLPLGRHFVTINCVVNLQGLVFPAPGAYSFDVYYGGEIAMRIPLQVIAQS